MTKLFALYIEPFLPRNYRTIFGWLVSALIGSLVTVSVVASVDFSIDVTYSDPTEEAEELTCKK